MASDEPDDSVDSFRPGVGRTTRKGYKWFTEVALPVIAPGRNPPKKSGTPNTKSPSAPPLTSRTQRRSLQKRSSRKTKTVQNVDPPAMHKINQHCSRCAHVPPDVLRRAATCPSFNINACHSGGPPYPAATERFSYPRANELWPSHQHSYATPLITNYLPTPASSSVTPDITNQSLPFNSSSVVPLVPRRHGENPCHILPSVQEGSSREKDSSSPTEPPLTSSTHQPTTREAGSRIPNDLDIWLPAACQAYVAVMQYIEHNGEMEASAVTLVKTLKSYAAPLNLRYNLDDEDPIRVTVLQPESEQRDLACRIFVQKVLPLFGDFVNLDPYFIFAVGKELKDWIIQELYSSTEIEGHRRWKEEIEEIYEEPPTVILQFLEDATVGDSESLRIVNIEDLASPQEPQTSLDVFLTRSPSSGSLSVVSSREIVQKLISSVPFKELPGGLQISYPSIHRPNYHHYLLESDSGVPVLDLVQEETVVLPPNHQLDILVEPFHPSPTVSPVLGAAFASAQIPQLLSIVVLIALGLFVI
ncbi:hypothetical protein DL96DRAFT_1726543 [Flagelloscypha sp. PMI_526]|nr:hypothetical protein DL96DRAFT_1726543 [Flagelloscypha sp. PMI_526]